MKILLVQPYAGYQEPSFFMKLSARLPALPNLTLQQLAALCPPDAQVDALDENRGDKIHFDQGYDLVGISCRTAAIPRAYDIADEFRRRGVHVVFGGIHPTALPEEVKHHADTVVIGEAEISFPQLLRDLHKGELKDYYRSNPVDPALIPHPRREVIDYILPTAAVEATRGCPVNCSFCFVRKVKGSVYRERPIDHVVEEIQSLRQRFLLFYDASLTIDPTYSKALFRELRGLGKHFSCYGNVNVLARDDELLRLASEAGCLNWCIGFDSTSQKTLQNIGKTTNKVEEYKDAVKKIKDHDMNITGSFIFGFDEHDTTTFKETMEMVRQLDIDMACFNILTPFPGTQLYDKIALEKRITSDDWARYSCGQTVFTPKLMSERELYEGTIWVLREYYRNIPTLQRVLKNAKHGYHPFMNAVLGNCLWYARKFDPGRN